MSDIENSLQIKLCYHELSTLWCSFAVQVEYGWTDRCKSDTTSQKVINWQQSYETDTSMYLKMRMSTLTPHSSYIVFGLQSRPAVSFTHTWVCTTNQMKSNIQHFWKQLSVLHNIIIITVILSLWTKMVKCSSYQPLVQWCPG